MREHSCQPQRRARSIVVRSGDFDSGVLGDDHHIIGRTDVCVRDHRWAEHRGFEAEHVGRADHDPEPVDRNGHAPFHILGDSE
ncbi:hypothetical protein ABH920_005330 [Catenulispora sp. EB89]